MERILFCKACGRALSRPVIFVSGTAPELVDETAPVPEGRAYKAHEPFRRVITGKPNPSNPLEMVPQVWMNLDDLPGEERYSPDTPRLNGCCGLDGCGGPNRICECGAHIGTELSDCWTPRMFVPDPAMTVWRDEENGR